MQDIPIWFVAIFFAIFGACLGSFYNVVVYRMPRGLSLISPPSFCPACKKRIPIWFNLPVIGWLILRGKSACCHTPISIRYPIGEALSGFLGVFALLLANYPFDWTGPVVNWQGAIILFWLLLAIYPVSAVDFGFHLVPDTLSVGGIVVGFAVSFFPGGISPVDSFAGAVFAGGGLFLLGFIASKILKKDAMGMGDVKLLAGYGAMMGFGKAFAVMILASFLALLVMLPYRYFKKETSSEIPFGPFLAIAAPIVYRFGDLFLTFYFGLFGIEF
ncbi:MAG: prepilin peptidase [Fibrobacteraceae bacterium]